jgi:D-alanyl-D-alanine endopeptidase (penicillin-binding protein 7)
MTASALTAKSFVVRNESNVVLAEQNGDLKLPIASISKILILGTNDNPWSSKYTISEFDRDLLKHTRLRLRLHSVYDGQSLLKYALITSNNEAIKALVRSEGAETIIATTNKHFVGKSTSLVEPSGLDGRNVSTANDLTEFALSIKNSTISSLSVSKTDKINGIAIQNTNPLLNLPGWDFKLSKTGYISESGGCVLAILSIQNKLYSIAILGSTNTIDRWKDLIEIRKKLNISNDKFFEPSFDIKHNKKSIKFKKR